MTFTAEEIARRIVDLLDQRHTEPGQHDMFGAITARLANQEIHGEALDGGVEFGTARGWFSLSGPKIWRGVPAAASKA